MSKFYTPKKPCKRCGTSQRYASNSSCVLCKKNTERERYERNRDTIKERNKAWSKNNPELVSSYKRAWRERNQDRIKKASADYWMSNKERISKERRDNPEYMRKYSKAYRSRNKAKARRVARRYYNENSEKIKNRVRVWGENNKNRVRANARDYQRRLRQTDLGKANAFMRGCIRRCLTKKGDDRTVDLIGYSPKDLKTHIEKQFTQSMSWSNYGSRWHIDHITPISYFLSVGIKDPKIINCLSNLRPLCKSENLKKGATIEFLI